MAIMISSNLRMLRSNSNYTLLLEIDLVFQK